ncbi:MAG: hypothetical protein K2Q01_03830, partial [Rickettsiales bacterium]|nr:hypothetical protein [Rickettsiales bacterium]
MAPSYKARFVGRMAAMIVLMMLVPYAITQVRYALDVNMYEFDQLVMFWLSRFHDPDLFKGDYVADYLVSQWMPPGYIGLNILWGYFADNLWLMRSLRMVTWFACMPAAWLIGRQLGGRVNAYVTLAFYVLNTVFMWRFVGGMPHSFAFPLLWWGVWGLVAGRPRILAICSILSAGLYPVVLPIVSLMLVMQLLFPWLCPAMPKEAPEFQYPFWGKIRWLMLPGLYSLMLASMLLLSRVTGYGKLIDYTGDEYYNYPESYVNKVLIEPESFLRRLYDLHYNLILSWPVAQWMTLVVLGISLLAFFWPDTKDRRLKSMRPFNLVSVAAFLIAFYFMYDHAYRFAIYSVPVFGAIYLPLGMRRVCQLIPFARLRTPVFVV